MSGASFAQQSGCRGARTARAIARLRRRYATFPSGGRSTAHLKQLIKKVGEEKAMAMLEKSEQGFKENYALLKKLSEM